MAYAAIIALAAANAFSLWALLRYHAQAQREWARERRELLNRIQRPDYLPAPTPEMFEIPDAEPDEIELINTIAQPSEDE